MEDGAEQSSDLSDEDDMHDIDVGGILERGYPYLHDVETDMSPENLVNIYTQKTLISFVI